MRFCAVLLAGLSVAPELFASDTIHLRPGQCIYIGAQEVCAMRADDPASIPAAPRPTTLASCQYGDKANEPGMKGYTLTQVTIKDDGTKTETVVKSFGSMPKDKADCEKEAARLDARSPRP